MSTSVGYSKTPLYKKLGLKSGFTIKLVNQPREYWTFFETLPQDLTETDQSDILKDFIHVFSTDKKRLDKLLVKLKTEIKQNGMIWVSWPKKTSQIHTTVNGDLIRNLAKIHGLIDVKVCAVNEIWSGLKLMIPSNLRK